MCRFVGNWPGLVSWIVGFVLFNFKELMIRGFLRKNRNKNIHVIFSNKSVVIKLKRLRYLISKTLLFHNACRLRHLCKWGNELPSSQCAHIHPLSPPRIAKQPVAGGEAPTTTLRPGHVSWMKIVSLRANKPVVWRVASKSSLFYTLSRTQVTNAEK